MEIQQWWHSYGPFAPGEDDIPHMGHVLKHYVRLSGLTITALVEKLDALGWDIKERRVKQLLSDQNRDEPQSISRRRLLSRLLSIPPALIGLSIIESTAQNTQLSNNALDSETFAHTEMALASFWANFYGSSLHHFDDGIMQWRNHIEDHTYGQKHIQVLLCKFNQLVAVSAKDRADYPTATFFHDESVNLAKELGDAELIASSLFRRAKTRIYLGRMNEAATDMQDALNVAPRCRTNLRGYIYQFTGQLVTLSPSSPSVVTRFERLMGEASKLLAKGNIEDDGSFVKFNIAGYQQDAARGYLRLGKTEQALAAIETAEHLQHPNMARWQIEMCLLRCEAYIQSNELEWASHQMQEGVKLIRDVTNSQSQLKKMYKLLEQIKRRFPNHPETIHLYSLLGKKR